MFDFNLVHIYSFSWRGVIVDDDDKSEEEFTFHTKLVVEASEDSFLKTVYYTNKLIGEQIYTNIETKRMAQVKKIISVDNIDGISFFPDKVIVPIALPKDFMEQPQ